MPTLDMGTLQQPERLAAAERAERTLAGLVLPCDRMARLASRLLDVPMGAICLVSGDEILVGRHGLAAPLDDARRVPMDYSFGKYIVSADAPVAVPDLLAHPELRHHRLTTEHGIRSFLGVPLHDTTGAAVGSIVVAGTLARDWTDRDVAVLTEIAGVFDPIPDVRTPIATMPDLDSAMVLDQINEAFIGSDADGRIISWNRAAERMFGWSAAEVHGLRWDERILAEPAGKEYDARVAEILATPSGQPRVEQGIARRRDGTEFPVEGLVHTMGSPNGPIVCTFLIDVSDRVETARVVGDQQSLLAEILEGLHTMLVVCDVDGSVVLLSRTLREFLEMPEDWTPTDVSGISNTVSRWDPDGRPMPKEQYPLTRSLAGEVLSGVVMTFGVEGKDRRDFLVNARPVVSADGRRLGAVEVLKDITEQRLIERLRACEPEIVKALAYARGVREAGLATIAAIATALRWPFAQVWLGEDANQPIYQMAFWAAPGRGNGYGIEREVLKRGEGVSGRAWSAGEVYWLGDLEAVGDPLLTELATRVGVRAGLGVPVRGADGPVGVLALFTEDQNEPGEATKAMLAGLAAHFGAYLARRQAAGFAAELGRSRNDFVSLVGHEIRTPLTSISSCADLLLADADEGIPVEREMLVMMKRQSQHLRFIVEDLLDLAGLESGHIPLRRSEVELVEVVRAAVSAERDLAEANHVELLTDLPDSLRLTADPARLRQLVDNLLSNAVKYSPDGGQVRLRVHEVDDLAEMIVEDQGVGVPTGERDRLFTRFFRASNTVNSGIQGVGLGLAIARAIVEAHGGTIGIGELAEAQRGTLLTVRLPLRPPTVDDPPAVRP
ncbi:PAS domain-containing sensor histidine kinase [Actinoplanes regularis]|uniref:PAS domain-containing sensor histidine kinase n=1 Tax=Actinoplanes regularis TaxID=52697 RepID=UPI0024A5B130|nr:ATP-binding protein [Actinoplanes regularis]GLW34164.1 hypothetical protein Areg01_71010 [Actinoplanes regularis]